MYVTHLETGTLTGQTARAQCRDTTLVRHLGERVVLVHELGQLGGAEELLDRRRNRLGVDQLLRHQVFRFGQGQTLFHRTFNTDQTDTELVLRHFTNRAHTAVTQVIDIINGTVTVADIDQHLHHINDILVGEGAFAGDLLAADTTVELHPANRRQVVTV